MMQNLLIQSNVIHYHSWLKAKFGQYIFVDVYYTSPSTAVTHVVKHATLQNSSCQNPSEVKDGQGNPNIISLYIKLTSLCSMKYLIQIILHACKATIRLIILP